MTAPESKTCALCGETKPLEDYFRCSRNADGRMWRCKLCVRAKQRTYNIDVERERQQKTACWAAYYARNGDAIRARYNQWARDNPDRKRASRNPELMRQDNERRRSRLLDAFIEDVPFDLILRRDLGVCGICRQPIMETTIELDHVFPLVAGGTHEPNNVQLAHRSCNRRKATKVNFTLVDAATMP